MKFIVHKEIDQEEVVDRIRIHYTRMNTNESLVFTVVSDGCQLGSLNVPFHKYDEASAFLQDKLEKGEAGKSDWLVINRDYILWLLDQEKDEN
jgi:hypothetical protein